jgi:outer membrane lipoprotein-sorting protein
MKTIIYTILLVFFVPGFLQTFAQDAVTLLENMDNLMLAPQDKLGNVQMILIDKSGNEKIREATMMQKGRDKRLYRYTKPESQAGIATLSLPGDIMWMYMPAFGKPTKISLLAKSQAFTGTDFSYEDMESKPYSERFSATLIETRQDAFVLELLPKSEKSKYRKIILSLNKEFYYPIRMEYYEKSPEKVKEAVYTYQKIGKYWNAQEVTMTDIKKGHSTRIILSDVKFDQGLTDEDFTVEKLSGK